MVNQKEYKAAIYASDKINSIKAYKQLEACKVYALDNGYTIIGEFIDVGYSKDDDGRKQFKQMLLMAQDYMYEYVIVYQYDRINTSPLGYQIYEETFSNYGVKIISITEDVEYY